MSDFYSRGNSWPWIQQGPYLSNHKKASFGSRLDVCLVNESSIHQPQARVYKLANNSLYLLDDPRTKYKLNINR